MRIITSYRSAFVFLLFLALSIAVQISHYTTSANVPDRDSGVFLYIGQQILDGSIPYRDVWDHKGPLIYYINALGLLIGHGSRAGVFFLEILSLFASVSLGYIAMKRTYGSIPAFFASIVWPLNLVYVLGGANLTEEYGLLFSFLTLYLFVRSRKSSSSLIFIFLIGAAFSLSFLLRPNNIGMQLSVAVFLLITGILTHRIYELFKQGIAFTMGAIAILIPALLYFKWNNALGDFFDQFIRYNIIYAGTDWNYRVDSVYTGLTLFAPSGLTLIACAAWIIGIFYLRQKADITESHRALTALAIIGLPVEIILSNFSYRNYVHYFILWLPVYAVLAGFFIFQLISNFSHSFIRLFRRRIEVSHVWVFAILITTSGITLAQLFLDFRYIYLSHRKNPTADTETIRGNMVDTNYLLMWGAEASYYFFTKMRSPTRYVYQYPLYTCGYHTDEKIQEFLDDIARTHPLIVDTSATNEDTPPIDNNERSKWKDTASPEWKSAGCKLYPKLDEVFDYINSRYKFVGYTEKNNWKIYKYAGGS